MLSRERAFPKIQFSFDLKFKFKFSINSPSKNHVSLYPLLAAPKQIGKATSTKIKGPSDVSLSLKLAGAQRLVSLSENPLQVCDGLRMDDRIN